MSKARTCIICEQQAKSAEHIFPAALGGRRTNRGIYCAEHNRQFGRLVTRLQRQLAMMNAALEVRPDREDKPKPFLFNNDGIRYKLLGADIDVDMPAPFDPSLVGVDKRYPLIAPSLEAARRWIAENQSDEWKFEIKGSDGAQHRYQTEQTRIPLAFGGVDFLQSVGYIALSSFAHSFPTEVRQVGLIDFKQMLRLDVAENPEFWPQEMVWWDGREPSSLVGENPYEFGHVIAVGVCKTTSRAYAYVSFFSCLSFGIDLGHVDPVNEIGYVRTFIDPTAESAAVSVTVVEEPDINPLLIEKGVSLRDMVHSGTAEEAMNRLQKKIYFNHADKAARQIATQLPSPPSRNLFEGLHQFMSILEPRGQTIFNLLHRNITFYLPKVKGQKRVPEFLKSFIKADDRQPNGLAPAAAQVLEVTKKLIASHMSSEHARGALDASKIRDLLYGDLGDTLIRELVISPMLRTAGITTPV